MTDTDTDTEAVTETRPIAGIDHALIGVSDLDAAREAYERLGFTVTPRGRHIGWGTGNHTVMFDNDYVELMGIVDPTQHIHNLDEFLKSGDGLFNVVLATEDADATYRWLREHSPNAQEVQGLQRLLTLDEGEELLDFRYVYLPVELTPGLNTFASQHLTPDKVRRPAWLSHPNGARRISEVTVVMERLDGVGEAYARLFGAEAISGDERKGSITVDTGNDELWFVTPKTFPERHYDKKFDESLPLPHLAALTLSVANPQVTALYLSGQQVAFERDSSEAVLVSSEEACGVFLVFARDD
ncbi:MAG: VOC family protein [Alphaproteobacteria bacterium]|nr:VOC family protein [Alphaproteobacteria bacterium]